jgi:hypothetical protein
VHKITDYKGNKTLDEFIPTLWGGEGGGGGGGRGTGGRGGISYYCSFILIWKGFFLW